MCKLLQPSSLRKLEGRKTPQFQQNFQQIAHYFARGPLGARYPGTTRPLLANGGCGSSRILFPGNPHQRRRERPCPKPNTDCFAAPAVITYLTHRRDNGPTVTTTIRGRRSPRGRWLADFFPALRQVCDYPDLPTYMTPHDKIPFKAFVFLPNPRFKEEDNTLLS